MTAGPAAEIPRSQLLVGDGLRAVAALCILVYHVLAWIGAQRYDTVLAPHYGLFAAHVFKALIAGIYVFFALSGYLVFRGFARSIVTGTALPSVRRYTWARVLRIVPAFWIAISLTLLLRGTQGASFGDIVALYGFAQMYDHQPAFFLVPQGWTLDVEALFYLALPLGAFATGLLARRLDGDGRRATALLAVLLALGTASTLRVFSLNPFPWEGAPFSYFVAFVPGMVLAVIEPFAAERMTVALGRVLPAGLVLIAAWLSIEMGLQPPDEVGERTLLGTLASGALLAAALVRQWSRGDGWRALDNRVLHWAGRRSYGIYLFHFLALTLIWDAGFNIQAPWPAAIVLSLLTTAATLVLAELSWRLVEQPAMRIRNRRIAARRVAVAQT